MTAQVHDSQKMNASDRSMIVPRLVWSLAGVTVIGAVITIGATIDSWTRQAESTSRCSAVRGATLKCEIPKWLRFRCCEGFAKRHFSIAVSAHIHVDETVRLNPSLRVLQQVDSLRTLVVAPAFIRRGDLPLMPVIPSVEKLVIGNHLSSCSETCQIDATREPPPSNDFVWDATNLDFLRGFTGVRELQLQALWLGPGALETILSLPKLESLQLHACRFPEGEIASLSAPQQLRSLRIYFEPVSSDLLDWIAKFQQLRELDMVVHWYSQGVLPGERELDLSFVPKQIEMLRLDGSRLNDDSWKRIASLPRLRILTVQGGRLDLPAAENMPQLSNLQWLDVRSLRQTDDRDKITLLNAAGDHCEILVYDSDIAQFRGRLELPILKRLRYQAREDLEHHWGY